MISIDIGSKNLHAARGSYNKGVLQVDQTASYEVPDGAITREWVSNTELLGDAISFLLKLANYNGKQVILTMNAADPLMVRDLDFPKAKPKELDLMVQNEMHQVHNALKTDIIQYKQIRNDDADGALQRYRAASISQNFVDQYYSTIKDLGLKPYVMDVNLNAIDKLYQYAAGFNGDRIDKSCATLLIDFGHRTTSVYILSDAHAMFFRHINIGSSEVDRLLEQDFPLLSTEERLHKKHNDPILTQMPIGTLDDEYSNLRPHFYRLNDEIRKVLTFFRGRFRDIRIERGYIFGNASQLKGYSEFWDLNLNLPIEPLKTIESKTGAKISVEPGNVNAIAALIRAGAGGKHERL